MEKKTLVVRYFVFSHKVTYFTVYNTQIMLSLLEKEIKVLILSYLFEEFFFLPVH